MPLSGLRDYTRGVFSQQGFYRVKGRTPFYLSFPGLIPWFQPRSLPKRFFQAGTPSEKPRFLQNAFSRSCLEELLQSFPMKRLWSPWRMKYISDHDPDADCFFCAAWARSDDNGHWVVSRGQKSFALLNLYPYTCGHLMVAPSIHTAVYENLAPDVLAEMMQMTQEAVRALKAAYKAAAFNIGLNLGEAAGAGVASHLHIHIVPRWAGDTNFMTTTGEVRVLPEELGVTWKKMRDAWEQ
jgi:ATP adenylyltransferase